MINIESTFMGATKQLPYLVKEIQKELPGVPINLKLDDNYSKQQVNHQEFIWNDLKTQGVELSNISINQPTKEGYVFNVGLRIRRTESKNSDDYNLWIDPLKFEERNLPNKEELSDIKKEYNLSKKRVVLAGSLRENELPAILPGLNEWINKNSKNVFVIVPRRDDDNIRGVLENEGISYSINKLEKGKSVLVIDTKGVLDKLWGICDKGIIGNTYGIGDGQNPLEPAFFGKKAYFGGHYSNNEDAYRGLQKSGLLEKADRSDLPQKLLKTIPRGALKKQIKAAQKFIISKQGAAKEYAQKIGEEYRNKQMIYETM